MIKVNLFLHANNKNSDVSLNKHLNNKLIKSNFHNRFAQSEKPNIPHNEEELELSYRLNKIKYKVKFFSLILIFIIPILYFVFFQEQSYGLLEQINLRSYIKEFKFEFFFYIKYIFLFFILLPIFLNGLALFMFNYLEKKGKPTNFSIFFNKISGGCFASNNSLIEIFYDIVANKDSLDYYRFRCKRELLVYIFILIFYILVV